MLDGWLTRRSVKPVRDISARIGALSAIKPLYFPIVHPERDIPYEALQQLTAGLVSDAQEISIPAVDLLARLIQSGPSREESVAITLISGIGNMNGQFAFSLARAPEEMRLLRTETFGPFKAPEMDRLWDSIKAELGGFDADGRIRLAYQAWDNRYIVRNSGAAHRFALWWRLQRYVDLATDHPTQVTRLPARVSPYSLDVYAMEFLTSMGRVLFCQHDDSLAFVFKHVSAADNRFAYLTPRDGAGQVDRRRPAMIVLPQMCSSGGIDSLPMMELHRWADHLFDLGRYLAERSSTYRL